MNFRAIVIAILSLLLPAGANPPVVSAAELPKTISSAPCRNPPTIDGKIDVDEWKEAKAINFELSMLKVKAGTFEKRACQLRVMNSANGLYISLRVPDPMVNKSLAPLDFDFASLAFSRGPELAAGDDRKGVAVGLYFDKHVTTPGQDADDQQKFITKVMAGKIVANQLTALKLQRLMDRYAGREWLSTNLVHLDESESERADVVRGLKTYVNAGREHARSFADLYAQLPSDKQVLPANVVRELQATAGAR